MNQEKTALIRVWDPVVRIGHWTLVACFFIAYFTEDDLLTLHVWAGYVLGAVVLFRLLWGFVGSTHARFSDFLYSPAKVAAYLRSLRKGPVAHYVGHNPAGGVMIILLLLFLSATVYTGLELYAVEEHAGPLAVLDPASGYADSDDDGDEDEDEEERERRSGVDEDAEEFWEDLHELFANLTLMLVILHVSGAVVSSYLHQENLVKAMITGKKARQ